jgi:hypothetical protein
MAPKGAPLTEAEQARNRLAAAVRRGEPVEVIDQARRDLAEANLSDAIRRARPKVAAWPLFTDEQISRLTALLRGEPDGQAAG